MMTRYLLVCLSLLVLSSPIVQAQGAIGEGAKTLWKAASTARRSQDVWRKLLPATRSADLTAGQETLTTKDILSLMIEDEGARQLILDHVALTDARTAAQANAALTGYAWRELDRMTRLDQETMEAIERAALQAATENPPWLVPVNTDEIVNQVIGPGEVRVFGEAQGRESVIEPAIVEQLREPFRHAIRAVLAEELTRQPKAPPDMTEEQAYLQRLIKALQQQVDELVKQLKSAPQPAEKPPLIHLDLNANTLTFRPVQWRQVRVEGYQIEDVTGKLNALLTRVKPYLVGGAVGTGAAVVGQEVLTEDAAATERPGQPSNP